MPIDIRNNGANNEVAVSAASAAAGSGSITLNGDDNLVLIDNSQYHIGIHVTVSGRGFVQIGRNLHARNLAIHLAPDCELQIGAACSFNGLVKISLHEPSAIRIGDGCLFGSDVDVVSSDMHSILDAATGARINPARSVAIGDRVWVGQKATILKGVTIGSGAVIGASAVVTHDVPGNSAAAGNPARVVRTGVTWDIRLL